MHMSFYSLPSNAVYVGVHIRRTDMLASDKYSVADVGYLRRSFHFMRRQFPGRQLAFVVCTDDMRWSKDNVPKALMHETHHVTSAGLRGNGFRGNDSDEAAAANSTGNFVAVFSERHGTEEDLAILSLCNHTIMTVGTFGWWAGYLSGGITIYYRNFPPKGSELEPDFSREDHFPPGWIGL